MASVSAHQEELRYALIKCGKIVVQRTRSAAAPESDVFFESAERSPPSFPHSSERIGNRHTDSVIWLTFQDPE